MIQALRIANFRSIEEGNLTLAPITVLFGPTSSGKSSVLYALYVLRNFIINPNQAVDGFFNLGFENLGGFEPCVFNHDATRTITIAATIADGSGALKGEFGISLSKSACDIQLLVHQFRMNAKVGIPYPTNQAFAHTFKADGQEFAVNWNGITSTVSPANPTAETQSQAQKMAVALNFPVEALKGVDIAPHKRGFFKPYYVSVPLSTTPTNEDEVATLVINDMNLPSRISVDAEEILGRDFRTNVPPGTTTAYFQTTEKRSRTPVYLVNDGFGVNQVIYMLAKIHRADVQTILIEEPEAHLHPTVIRDFARAACRIVAEDRKQLVFTTHSEHLLIAILGCVSDGIIRSTDVRCYQSSKEKRSTTFKEQEVTPDAQIVGGLSSFIAAELEDLKKFLSLDSQT